MVRKLGARVLDPFHVAGEIRHPITRFHHDFAVVGEPAFLPPDHTYFRCFAIHSLASFRALEMSLAVKLLSTISLYFLAFS